MYVLHFFLRIHFYSILWLFIFSWHLVTRATPSLSLSSTFAILSIQFQTILSLSYSSNMYSTYKLASNRGNRLYIQTKSLSTRTRRAHTALCALLFNKRTKKRDANYSLWSHSIGQRRSKHRHSHSNKNGLSLIISGISTLCAASQFHVIREHQLRGERGKRNAPTEIARLGVVRRNGRW